MTWIFLAAAIFGVPLLVPMLFGAFDNDVEFDGDVAELDADFDTDFDTDADFDADGQTPSGFSGQTAVDSVLSSIVSFRTLVFFSAFFGVSGLVFDQFDYSPLVTVGTALFIGVSAGLANSVLFGLLKGSQTDSQVSNASLRGRPATVVLPIHGGRRGRIRIDINHQPHYLVARAVEDGLGQQFDVGDSVVVVQMDHGTALVSELSALEFGEEQ